MSLLLKMKKELDQREDSGCLRQLCVISHLVDFASNDYLGLARAKKLKLASMMEWMKETLTTSINGLGSTGSRLLTGNSLYAQKLEEEIAHFHGFEAGLFFNCGYMANVGLISSVAAEKDSIFYDTSIHASTHDGIRLSKAQAYPFKHNDLDHLEKRLKQHSIYRTKFVCVESVYSTDGSIAPLEEMCSLCEKYQAELIVDEAHAVGVFGEEGRGVVFGKKLIDHVFAKIVTFGKALGASGAIVLGSRILREHLINFSRPFIYTTALPLQNLATIKHVYETFPKMDSERIHLRRLIERFQKGLIKNSPSLIQPLFIAGNKNVQKASLQLALKGFDVRAIKSPTVARGRECLRISLHAFNTEKEVADLINLIGKYA